MPLYIVLTAKNFFSLKKFLLFINRLLKKKYLLSFYPESCYNLKTKKTRITVLKSPHVNKKAKESFELTNRKTVLVLYSSDLKKDLMFLKYLNTFLFWDIKMSISFYLGSKPIKSFLNKYKANPNKFIKNNECLSVFDAFGEHCFINKTI